MYISIIEDHREIADNIKEFLEVPWNKCYVFNSWEDFLKAQEKISSDIIVLDVMLPWMNGFEIASIIRKTSNVPIIFLTSKGEVNDKLLWFKSWWDDYIVKPFSLLELEARIQSIYRRLNNLNTVNIWDISYLPESKQVFKNNQEISITLQESCLLESLVKLHPHPVSRTDLINDIWGDQWIRWKDDQLDVLIAKLRKKLGKEVISTRKGFGYKLWS